MEDRQVSSLSDPARGRAWLASLLLQRQSRLMPRFALALARLRALPRGQRQRLKRRAAATLAGAALVLAIGAASFGPPGVGVAHAATITVANGEIAVNDNGVCSIIEAIINANDGAQTHDDCAAGSAGSDTINLPAGGTFSFTTPFVYDVGDNGLPTITTPIIINGNSSTLDLGGAVGDMRLALVDTTGDLTLNAATVSNGVMNDATYGGGVFEVIGGALTVADSTLSGNATDAYGGAIFARDSATVMVTGSTLSGNVAFRGGAIYGRDSAVTLTDSAVTGNTASRTGGGVQVRGGSLEITGGTVNDNGWEPGKVGVTGYVDYGGGVLASSATVKITGATIDGNSGGYSGGGVRLDDVTGALITGTTITNNTAGVGGGVQWGAFGDGGAYPVTGTIRDSIIDGNTASFGGGGIQMTAYSTLTVERTTISDNIVTYTDTYGTTFGYGGGVANFSSTLTITQSAIHDNSAGADGGGLYLNNYGGGPTAVTNTTISGNSAGRKGGGAFLSIRPNATFNNVTISDNESLDGGGLTAYNSPAYAGTGTVTLNRTIVSGNRSRGYGAEILTINATITANNVNLFGHSGITNGTAFNGFTPGASDITATSDGTEPKALGGILAALADNGGPTTPATKTHALVAGSPAIDRAANAACVAPSPTNGVDQRDVIRNQDGNNAASANECDIGAYEYVASPVTGICPAPGFERTTILGVGMGSPKKATTLAKIVLPNRANLVDLYGQLVGKQVGHPKFVRFLYPNGTYVQVDAITSPAPREAGIFWYGAALDPAAHIRGRWFMQKGTGKVPRAFLLYATYTTPDSYFNRYTLFDDGNTNQVGPVEPWATHQTFILPIDAPLGPADVTVQVALVDNDKDTRPITVSATAGTASDSDTANGPTNGNTLNLITLVLEDVPAGTTAVTLNLDSGTAGDSAAIVGAAVNYRCER